jgi:Flp pilus assembly protein TadB
MVRQDQAEDTAWISAFHPLPAFGGSCQASGRMLKPPLTRQPWQWKPPVRSRAIECSWFAMAVAISALSLWVLVRHGGQGLSSLAGAPILVVACLAIGLWNRRKRRQEKAFRLLP